MLKKVEMQTDDESGSKNAGHAPKKRVRFLDRSVAQELIKREKLNHENRVKALRQKYNFSKEAENKTSNGYKQDTNNNVDIFPLDALNHVRRPSTALSLRTKQKESESGEEKPRRARSASLIRINQLAQPRQRGRMSSQSQNTKRRSTIITLSPDHLRLSVPQKLPRSSNQLKELPDDELDYLLQPKSLKEFHALAEMTRSSSSSSRNRSGSRTSSAAQGRDVGRPATASKTPQLSGIGTSTTNMTPDATESQTTQPRGHKLKPKFKPTLKIATTAVISSMNENRSHNEKVQEDSSPAMKAWTSLLNAKSPSPSTTGRYVLPGGRVMRLRPRRLSWDVHMESKAEPEEEKVASPKSSLEDDTGSRLKEAMNMAVVSPPPWKNRSMMSYHSRNDPRSLDISQLTKDLAKCTYLRGREDVT